MEALNSINAMLVEMLGPLGPVLVLGALGLFLVLVTLLVMPKPRRDPLDKLRETGGVGGAGAGAGRAGFSGDGDGAKPLRTDDPNVKLEKFAQFLEPQDETEMSDARLKMLQAGYRSKSAVRAFHAAQFALGIGFLMLGVLYALVTSATGNPGTTQLALSVVVPGLIGYYMPQYWVQRRRQSRQQEIEEGFADALDLMLVCVEAGQSLDQSIMRVAQEMRSGYPALAEEFELVSHEARAGKDRITVLKDMSERCGVPDVASFVTVLVQSASFGTSIADALRVYAAEMRDKRVMRAEEKANVLPTKLTLGTMMFTVPPLLIILIGPSVVGIMDVFGGGGASVGGDIDP